MEQKLAEFRARRQAEKAAQKSETTGSQSRGETAADTAAQCDKTPTADSLQPEDTARNNQTATDGSQSSVRDNFNREAHELPDLACYFKDRTVRDK